MISRTTPAEGAAIEAAEASAGKNVLNTASGSGAGGRRCAGMRLN